MAEGVICRRGGSGGSGIPSTMLEKVTAPALENITIGQAVEYRMYPGEDVFNYSSQANPAQFLAASPDLSILCFRGTSTSTYRYLYIWRLIDGQYSLVQTIDSGLAANYMEKAEVSSDNQFIVASYGDTNKTAFLWKHDGNSFVKTSAGMGCGSSGSYHTLMFTPNGGYLVIGRYDSALSIYKIDKATGTTTPCTVTGALTGSEGTSSYRLSCDLAANYILHTFGTTGTSTTTYRLQIFKRTGDTFAPVVSLSNSTVSYNAAISLTGKYVATNKTSSMDFYTFQNDVLTLVTPSAGNWPTTTANHYAFSPDGKYLYAAPGTTPYILIMKIDTSANTLQKLANPTTLPTDWGYVYCSADSRQILYGRNTSAILSIYTTGAGAYMLLLRNLCDARYLALNQYTNYKLGIADATVAAGQPCTATMVKVLNEVIT